MITSILNKLNAYLDGTISCQALESWIAENLQAIIDSGEQDSLNLATQIDSILIHAGEAVIRLNEANHDLSAIAMKHETVVVNFTLDAGSDQIEVSASNKSASICADVVIGYDRTIDLGCHQISA